uniref:GDP-mannose dehydrogenase n=1 Tax=Ignisphaera aggregans TaxID=334771 RepID=A0A7C4FIG6_9CREN
MYKVVVIGLGEVGNALYTFFRLSSKFEVYGYDLDPQKSVNKLSEIPKDVDFLHITIPFSNKFIDAVQYYASTLNSQYIVIHSTVAPGTTRKVFEKIGIPTAFSPIRGKHPNILKHLHFWTKWIASLPQEALSTFVLHHTLAGFRVREYYGNPESLELAKLWETVYRAIMIASWHEIHRIAVKFNADLTAIAEFVGEVHKVLHDRPLYYPDYIGGHCLIPNTMILNSVAPSKLFEFVLESNEKRLKEKEDAKIHRDIEKMKQIVQEYINREYYI